MLAIEGRRKDSILRPSLTNRDSTESQTDHRLEDGGTVADGLAGGENHDEYLKMG